MKIESGILIPPSTGRGRHKYPWESLEIGDSFFSSEYPVQVVSSSAGKAGKKLKRKFTCRSVEQNGIKGVRAWRIS